MCAFFFFFFFNDTATTEIYPLSLHDALPISKLMGRIKSFDKFSVLLESGAQEQLIFKHAISTISHARRDRKSTRLNSSHLVISYAVFCLKKKTEDRVV